MPLGPPSIPTHDMQDMTAHAQCTELVAEAGFSFMTSPGCLFFFFFCVCFPVI